jgi:flagellin-like protein
MLNKKVGKRGISPLIATVLLVAFAVSLGAVVMNWAKGTDTGAAETSSFAQTSECLVKGPVSEPLKQVMVNYLQDEISKQEFFSQANSHK